LGQTKKVFNTRIIISPLSSFVIQSFNIIQGVMQADGGGGWRRLVTSLDNVKIGFGSYNKRFYTPRF
jgi:hypothetical protein